MSGATWIAVLLGGIVVNSIYDSVLPESRETPAGSIINVVLAFAAFSVLLHELGGVS